jgi:hypothetical protein
MSDEHDHTPLDLRTRYAWDWFSHHANQRFTAFNFFLVALGAVTVAFATAETHRFRALGVGLAILAAVVALAFFMLDVRNAQIVEFARHELERLEQEIGVPITGPSQTQRRLLVSHKFWFRSILAAAGALAVAAGIWAASGFGHDAHRAGESNRAAASKHPHSGLPARPHTGQRRGDRTHRRRS